VRGRACNHSLQTHFVGAQVSSLLTNDRSIIIVTTGHGQQQVQQKRWHHSSPFDPQTTQGWKAAKKEATIPTTKHDAEVQRGLKIGLQGASSINDKTIPTFLRGDLPHFAGINTFLKAPYLEDVNNVGDYDVAVVSVPFDGGCTYRSGTRFGPQGIRRISALYMPYNYERGIDLREQMSLCDVCVWGGVHHYGQLGEVV
jgi:agmatinase